VISTGIEVDSESFPLARAMRCRFCGHGHPWEVVEEAPEVSERVSKEAEVFLRRSVQNDTSAAKATDPVVRELYWHVACYWFRRAVDEEAKDSRGE